MKTGLNYSYGDNGFNEVVLIDSLTLLQNKTIANTEVSHYLALSISYQIYEVKRWTLNTYFSATYSMIQSNNASVNMQKITNFGLSLYTTLAYTLDRKKTFFAELSLSATSPWIQQLEVRATAPSYSIEIRKTLLNKRLSLALSMNNLLIPNRMKSRITINGVTTNSNGLWDSQSIYLHLSYSFGNRNMSVNQKSSGSTGESGRFK